MTVILPGVEMCVFDAYGTLFDFNSAVARHRDDVLDRVFLIVVGARQRTRSDSAFTHQVERQLGSGAQQLADASRLGQGFVAEVVVEDPTIRAAARESFRFYREQGYPLQDHRLQRL